MAIQFDENGNPNHVSVVTEAHELLTNSERLTQLYLDGFHFESAASQILIVEALTVMYLLMRAQAYGIVIVDRKGEKAKLGPLLTFGRAVSLLESSNAYHHDGIEADLRNYVGMRNDLVHNLSGTTLPVDLHELFELGKLIITALRSHLVGTCLLQPNYAIKVTAE